MLFKKASNPVNVVSGFARAAIASACMSFAAGAVYAQSSVTLYGIVDVGIEHINIRLLAAGRPAKHPVTSPARARV